MLTKTENIVAVVKTFLAHPNRKLSTKQIQDSLPNKVSLRTTQRLLNDLCKIGFIQSDKAHPQGFKIKEQNHDPKSQKNHQQSQTSHL